MYRSMTGLGLLEWTGTGVRSVGTPTCVTQGELAEAQAKCPPEYHKRLSGLGLTPTGPMSGRLSPFSACAVAALPVCPAPKCIDQYTAGLIAACVAGTSTNPDLDCSSLYAYALSQLPYCPGASGLQPVPRCLSPELLALRDYCASTNGNGANKGMNAVCWAAMHDPSYWAQAMAAKPCYAQAYVPPVTSAPESTPQSLPEEPTDMYVPEKQEASMAGTWGILALLAVAGGGYYMYRRNKR
jgi:hypothetical protein